MQFSFTERAENKPAVEEFCYNVLIGDSVDEPLRIRTVIG
jgi:hypothetical protein